MIVGARVRWRHLRADGTNDKPDFYGIVVACERGGTPAAWTLLVLLEDGTLTDTAFGNVVVECGPAATMNNFLTPAQVPLEEEPVDVTKGLAALEDLRTLEEYLRTNFETEEKDQHPVDQAIALFGEFREELLTATKDKNALVRERDEALEKLTKLRAEKKPKGPKGPGEKTGES